MLNSSQIIELLHENEEKRKKKIARFKKCIFHLHTPDSFDYELVKGVKNWRKLSDKELIDLAKKIGVIPEVNQTKNFKISNFDHYKEGLFSSSREVLAFLMVAHQLLINKIELVVITDHNIVSGYLKLEKSIVIMRQNFSYEHNIHTEVILGVEISCSDRCHVVGMFDNRIEKDLAEWLLEVATPKHGTYLSSREVLEQINKMKGLDILHT